MKPNNPFLISGYYSPEFFCDREQETGTILDALHNGRNVALIAQHHAVWVRQDWSVMLFIV